MRKRELWERWRTDDSVSRFDFEGIDSVRGVASSRTTDPDVVRAVKRREEQEMEIGWASERPRNWNWTKQCTLQLTFLRFQAKWSCYVHCSTSWFRICIPSSLTNKKRGVNDNRSASPPSTDRLFKKLDLSDSPLRAGWSWMWSKSNQLLQNRRLSHPQCLLVSPPTIAALSERVELPET